MILGTDGTVPVPTTSIRHCLSPPTFLVNSNCFSVPCFGEESNFEGEICVLK